MADFEWYLNRQGARGQKGEKGDTGEAVSIEVVSDTANEYILKFVSASGETVTPNLRGTLIDTAEEGTYVRYNPETQQVYTSDIEMASTTTTGAVRFTTEEELLDSDSGVVVSPSDMQDYLFSKLQQGDNITINKDETNGNITISSTGGGGGTGGTSDYNELTNKPQINSVELTGNKTLDDLDIQRKFNAVNPLNFNLATQSDLVNTTFDEVTRTFRTSQNSIRTDSSNIVTSLFVDKDKQSADTPDLIFPSSCTYFPFSQNIGFNSQSRYRGIMLGTRNPNGSFTPKFGIGDCLFPTNNREILLGAPYLKPRTYTSGSSYIDIGFDNADRLFTGGANAVAAKLTDSSLFSGDSYYRIAQLIKNETSKGYEFVFIGLLTTKGSSLGGVYSKVIPLSKENTAIIDSCDTVCVLSSIDGWDKHSYGKVVNLTNIDLRDYVNATPEEKYQLFKNLDVPTPAEAVETNYLQVSTATTSQLGVVKPDGTSITIDGNGTISSEVPTKTSDLTNDSGFITSSVNNLANYTPTSALATVATSGSYNDLTNKPSIPEAYTLPTASTTTLGGVKVDGTTITITPDGTISSTGGSGGTTDYTQLANKPQINSVELTGNKTLVDIGAQAITDNTLTTTAKTIVGAINELVTRIAALETQVTNLNTVIDGQTGSSADA